jgi:acyl-coenzyme A synthetase/AMP-(fatty) acid ligase
MQANTVLVDRNGDAARLLFSPSFNVVVPFIDRHLTEGRGGKVAIHSRAGDVTYAELAANVNRAAATAVRFM